MSHGDARLTPHGRFLLIHRVLDDRRPVAHVAKELGVSPQVRPPLGQSLPRRGRRRPARPHTSPARTDPATEQRVITARQVLRAGPDAISDETGVLSRTVTRVLTRHDIPPLVALAPLTGEQIRATRRSANRYQHAPNSSTSSPAAAITPRVVSDSTDRHVSAGPWTRVPPVSRRGGLQA